MGPYLWPKSKPVEISLENIKIFLTHQVLEKLVIYLVQILPKYFKIEVIINFWTIFIANISIGGLSAKTFALFHLVLHFSIASQL
jgi:hypothetical protein